MKQIARDAEVRLIETLSDLHEDAEHWTAICFAFSRLLEHYRSDYQLKIAINLIQDVIKNHEAMLFRCDDCTLFLLVRDVPPAILDKLVFQLRYLFMDDPLAYSADGEENSQFSHVYELGHTWQDFMQISKARLGKQIKRGQGGGNSRGGDAPVNLPTLELENALSDELPTRSTIKQLDASALADIERDLRNADLSRVLRRQPICAAVPDTMVRRVFDEIYINIAHLRRILGADVDLLSNRWLFKYITEILDIRMLSLLKNNPARYLDNPISLNFNVQTLLSEAFAEFDASIKPAVKFSIVIEIQLADVFNDIAAFIAAKNAVQKLGYRVCLDGVTELSFSQIDRKRLGFDLIKLQWNANILDDISKEEARMLDAAVKECGVNRIILTRCDNRKAIDYGQALGVSLFQGRYLDKLINPKATIEN
jgi:EAL domain-containing protein (putative c-di-GMP-specific phosphodiesterase class I)